MANKKLRRDPLSNNPLDFSLPEEVIPFESPNFNLPIESSARARLRSALENIPERESVSGKRKLFAAITGGLTGATQGGEAGAKAATDIIEAPYRRKSEDWRSKIGPLQAEVELERGDLESENLRSQIQERQTQMDPNYRARLQGAITGAELEAKEPYEEKSFGRNVQGMNLQFGHDRDMEGLRNRNITGREEADRGFRTRERLGSQEFQTSERIGEQGFRRDERVEGQKFTGSQNEADRQLRKYEGAADRANRLAITDKDNRTREELARVEATKKTGVSVDQQLKAIREAEDQVLRQLPEAARKSLGISLPVSQGSAETTWRFKPVGDIIDPRLKEIYDTNMREVMRRAKIAAYGDISGFDDTEDEDLIIEETGR